MKLKYLELLSLTTAMLCLAPAWSAEVAPLSAAGADYRLGPEDVITITAADAEELGNQPIRIETSGSIRLPMVGRIDAAGLSVEELAKVLETRLKVFIKRPQVSIRVTEYRSQPVTVIGAVGAPGVQQVQGRKSLLEMLSLAGGLRADAGYSLRITRRLDQGSLDLPGAKIDASGQFTVAEIDLESLMKASSPKENIAVRAHDIVSVPTADMLFVVGEVRKSGGFTMKSGEHLSVLVALSMAEGVTPLASPNHAKILRLVAGESKREEIPVNLSRILSGKANDVALQRNDVLFVPNSLAKSVTRRTLETALQVGTGLVIWRR